MNSLELISYRIPRPNAYSPARRLAGSPPRTAAALRPAASYAFLFWRGNALKNGMERQGLGGNGSTSSRKAHMGRNEPFGCKYERCLAKPIFKRNGEAQIYMCLPRVWRLRDTPPTQRAQIPAIFRKNYKMAGIAPYLRC